MTFTEDDHPRADDGRFGTKTQSLPDIEIANPDAEPPVGEWFATGHVVKNGTEVLSDGAVGDSYDRSWTMRRSDGRYVTRTVTFFVEEFGGGDNPDPDGPVDRETYTVMRRTTDSVSDTLGGEPEYIEDEFAEDAIADDTAYDLPKWAYERAERCAANAEKGPYLDGWEGYDEWATAS